MKELIDYLAKSLAYQSQEVSVSEAEKNGSTVFALKVAPDDLNHIIGKHGRTIKAMRSLLAIGSSKSGRRFMLDLVENEPAKPAV